MSECKYKPGDIVTVRNDLEIGKSYRMLSGPTSHSTLYGDSVIDGMTKLAGKKVTIKEIAETSRGGLEYRLKESNCLWTDEMFERPCPFSCKNLL